MDPEDASTRPAAASSPAPHMAADHPDPGIVQLLQPHVTSEDLCGHLGQQPDQLLVVVASIGSKPVLGEDIERICDSAARPNC